MTQSGFSKGEWASADGLTLRYREYGDASAFANKPAIICLHGLTRNSRDFHNLAVHLASDWRVIVPDMRGRGKSDYSAASADYAVNTYVADVVALRAHLGIEKYVAIATSMGGIMTMVQAAHDAGPIVGTVLNDIGPVIDPEGLAKIRDYVGQGRTYPTWMHAARGLADTLEGAHPDFDLTDWIAMAKRLMTLCGNGRIAYDYDMRLAEPIQASDENAVPPELWEGFAPLAQKPLLLVRGALSNLLSEETFAEMARRAPGALSVTVPGTGHAPTLDEPEARSAIDAWLARIG